MCQLSILLARTNQTQTALPRCDALAWRSSLSFRSGSAQITPSAMRIAGLGAGRADLFCHQPAPSDLLSEANPTSTQSADLSFQSAIGLPNLFAITTLSAVNPADRLPRCILGSSWPITIFDEVPTQYDRLAQESTAGDELRLVDFFALRS